MNDEFKSKQQLIDEIKILREQVNNLNTRQQLVPEEHLIREIESRKCIEQALRESEELYKALVELSPDTICVHMEERIMFVNKAGVKLLGAKSPDDLAGRSILDFVHPDYIKIVKEKLQDMKQKGGVIPPFEQKFVRIDGATIDVEATALPLYYKGIPATIVIARDITERNKFIKMLKESRDKYRQIVKYAPAGIYEIDFKKLKFNSVNDVMCEYTGYTEKEFLSMNVLDILSEDSKKHFLDRLQRLNLGDKVPFNTEFCLKRKNGQEIWAILNARYKYHDGKPIGATMVAHNITDRKKMEEALYKSQQKFKEQYMFLNALMENMNELLFTYDETANITFVNSKIYDILGYRPMEILGTKIVELISEEHKQEVEKKIFRRLKKGNKESYETKAKHKDGGERILKINASPIFKNGYIKGGIVLAEDVTELKQIEQEMVRLDRLNIVGEMAASIGHEVRNPMTTIRGFLQLLRGKSESLQYKEYYDLMIEELDRANAIISHYLSLAKDKPVDKRMLNLNNIIETIFPLIQADAFKSDKYIELRLNAIPELLLDEKEIRQLILNLTRNGLEAMSPGGKLNVSTFVNGIDVNLAIKDQGPGIEPKVLEKLGSPFITTKENGTGLGLAVCYRIAARHKAKISVETCQAGTTFMVTFSASKHT